MATSTVNKAGEDYNTLTLWEADKNGDLVTATEGQIAECYNDDGVLTDDVTIDGSTTNATYYMEITVPAAERHDGTRGTGFVMDANNYGFRVYDNYTRISWVEVKDSAQRAFYCTATDLLFGHILGYNLINTAVHAQSGSTFIVHNSMFFDFATLSTVPAIMGDSGATAACIAYNCTLLQKEADTDVSSCGIRYCKAVNCVAMHFGGTSTWRDYLNLGAGSSNNCSHDETGDVASKAAANQFATLTEGSEDLHLKSGADCIDAGSDLGSPYDYDIDNVLRTGTWDIGADQLVAAGPSFQPYQMGGNPMMTTPMQRGLVT